MEPIRWGIVGAGWRTEFYLRVAQACPDRFAPPVVVCRRADRAAELTAAFGVRCLPDCTSLPAADQVDFVVTSLPWPVNPQVVLALVQDGYAVLSETPPAPDLAGLQALWTDLQQWAPRVQVAEQYHLQPALAARLAFAASGRLGTVRHVQVSHAHGYHGISLLRRFLNLGCEPLQVRGWQQNTPILAGPGRQGWPAEPQTVERGQQFGWFEAGDRAGLLDFSGEQYFNPIRGHRLLVRGERGEIVNDTAVAYSDHRTPRRYRFERWEAGPDGNLEGLYLKGIQAGEQTWYSNPLAPGRLTDDEVAVGDCLLRMAAYAAGGPPFYPLAEGCQDHYLTLLWNQATASGETVATAPQPWHW